MSETLADTLTRWADDDRGKALHYGGMAVAYLEAMRFSLPVYTVDTFAEMAVFYARMAVRYAKAGLKYKADAADLVALQAMQQRTPGKCWRWGQPNDPLWEQCLLPEEHVGPCVTSQGPTLPVYR